MACKVRNKKVKQCYGGDCICTCETFSQQNARGVETTG